MTDKYVNLNIQELLARSKAGLEKYNTDLEREDLSPSQWCQHAIEELLDGANYLQTLKAKLEDPDALHKEVQQLRHRNETLERFIRTQEQTIAGLRIQIGGQLGPG